MNSLNQLLKQGRKNAGLTQLEVAKRLGYNTPQFVSNWERGICDAPFGNLKTLSKLFGISKESMIRAAVSDFEIKLRKRVK